MNWFENVKGKIFQNDDEDYIDENEYDEYEAEYEPKSSVNPFQKKSKVVQMNNAAPNKIVILKPKSFEESRNIADEIKRRMPVVFDVGGLQPEEARRVVDFVAGAVYGVDGTVQRVSGGIFVAAPSHFDIMGEIKEKMSKGDIEDWTMFN